MVWVPNACWGVMIRLDHYMALNHIFTDCHTHQDHVCHYLTEAKHVDKKSVTASTQTYGVNGCSPFWRPGLAGQ